MHTVCATRMPVMHRVTRVRYDRAEERRQMNVMNCFHTESDSSSVLWRSE